MRPATDLAKLHSRVAANLSRIRRRANAAMLSSVKPPAAQAEAALLTIELLNTWAGFVRAYYFSLCYQARRRSGGRVMQRLGRVGESTALMAAMSICKPWVKPMKTGFRPFQEPSWRAPKTLMKLTRNLKCSNDPDVIKAFSHPTTVFDHLHEFRHFFAHRGKDTYSRVASLGPTYGVSVLRSPAEVMLRGVTADGRPLIAGWASDIEDVCDLLCT